MNGMVVVEEVVSMRTLGDGNENVDVCDIESSLESSVLPADAEIVILSTGSSAAGLNEDVNIPAAIEIALLTSSLGGVILYETVDLLCRKPWSIVISTKNRYRFHLGLISLDRLYQRNLMLNIV